MSEMSSISTLEVAWENKSLWPSWWDETYFCVGVAWTNKLEFLKWIREEKKCEWDEWTIQAAACKGNLEMVKYCVANECPIRTMRCGHLEVLKYLREEAKVPWDPAKRSTYSNILLSVSMINMTIMRVSWRPSSATWTV